MKRSPLTSVTRFAHPGTGGRNYANHVFHLRQAVLHATSLMAHIAGAERDKPGCTGEAMLHLKELMGYLQRNRPAFETKGSVDVRSDQTNGET